MRLYQLFLGSLGSLETILAPGSLWAHMCFYLEIPEAFIRAGMPSSYCLFEFSTGYFVSLGSNSVFYRRTKIKCNLAILCPLLNALV